MWCDEHRAMETLLSSLIQLFGTISALALTFLVLLYDAAKRQRENTRQKVLLEVTNAFECNHVKNETGMIHGHHLHDRLAEQCKHGQVEEVDVNEMLIQLRVVIAKLRLDGIEILPAVEVGRRSQAAVHLEKYHEKDISDALRAYSRAMKYFAAFPARARRVVGFPLAITAVFTMQLLDASSGDPVLPLLLGKTLIPLLSFPCLGYIYLTVTTSLKELHSIDG